MSSKDKTIDIFLGSPGDVLREREIVNEIVNEINELNVSAPIKFDVTAWDTDEYIKDATQTPQQNIINGLKRPSACQVGIFIFWERIGTELTPASIPDDHREIAGFGDLPLTGSVWEMADFIFGANEPAEKKKLLWFRSFRPPIAPPTDRDKISQLGNVVELFSKAKDDKNRYLREVIEYRSDETFREKIKVQLKLIFKQYHDLYAPEFQPDKPLAGVIPSAASKFKKVDVDKVIAHLNRKEHVASFQNVTNAKSPQFATFIAQGDAEDWLDGLRVRLQSMDAHGSVFNDEIFKISWPYTKNNRFDQIANQLWAPLIDKSVLSDEQAGHQTSRDRSSGGMLSVVSNLFGTAGHAEADNDWVSKSVVRRLGELFSHPAELVVVNYEMRATQRNNVDDQLLEACYKRWEEISKGLETISIVLIFSIIEPKHADAARNYENRFMTLFGGKKQIDKQWIREIFSKAISLPPLEKIADTHLGDWVQDLDQKFHLPNEQIAAISAHVGTQLARQALPALTLRNKLLLDREFTKLLEPPIKATTTRS